jgi:hypothetical protein
MASENAGLHALWGPPIALPENTDEKRPTRIHHVHTDAHYFVPLRLRWRDPPAQVDNTELGAAFEAMQAELRKDFLDQRLSLRLHIPKRGGEKDANMMLRLACHG